MRIKGQFQREVNSRAADYDPRYVVKILTTYPAMSSISEWPDEVSLATDSVKNINISYLKKDIAERLYTLVMPLADRNMYVSLKQERYAGRDMEEVRHVFIQLTNAVQHMHDKGYLHGDIKPLNVVRMGTQWALIDFDASCVLGVQAIGTKSSTAYICPEAIYISTDESKQKAIVKSEHNRTESGLNFDLLLAHTSFDVCDSESVRKLYDLLTVKGLRVWWDVNCLLPANYSTLQTTSSCDNVLLEQRLALELRKMGDGCCPQAVNLCVESVETSLIHAMERQSL
eukprot:gene37020-48316_t